MGFYMKNAEKNNFNNLIPVAYIGHIPLVLVVNKNFPAKTIDGFKQLPKDQIIKYASSGLNTSTHLTGAVFSQNFSNTFVHVPYKGIAQGIPNLLAGITDMAFVPWPIVEPYIKTGQLIPLAVVSLDRLNKFPEVPTFKELGFKNFGFKTWFVLLASPNTNSNSIKIIQDSLVQTLNSNKSQQYTNIGIELDISQILNSKEFLDKEINLYREFYQKNPQFNSNKLK
jgi:tripartite-type tricarboxylate transporter receptor subunit TctC